jgi:hypothetical protein
MHKRQSIRTAVQTMLSGHTDVGTSVFANRVSAFWREELPCISIFTKDEQSQPRDLSGRQSIRNLTLAIEVRIEVNENLDDSLDTIANQIEDIISADTSLMGQASGAQETSTVLDVSVEGDKQIGLLTLTYTVTYIQ